MYNLVKKVNHIKSVLHIDLMCNAGPYWSRQIAAMAKTYVFADSSDLSSVNNGLKIAPTHIVLGGGFWNSEICKQPAILEKYIAASNPIVWSYWGDGTMSLVNDPFPNSNKTLIDIIFCSSDNAVEKFRSFGYSAEYAVHPVESMLYYEDKTIDKIYDWSFIGTNYGTTRGRQLDIIKSLGYKYFIGGPGHAEKAPILSFEQTATLMRQSKITININDDFYTNLDRYFSDRIPMAMMCGSMVLTTYQPGLERLFNRGHDIDWFYSDEELIEKIHCYINNDALRNNVETNCINSSADFSIQKMIPRFFETARAKHITKPKIRDK